MKKSVLVLFSIVALHSGNCLARIEILGGSRTSILLSETEAETIRKIFKIEKKSDPNPPIEFNVLQAGTDTAKWNINIIKGEIANLNLSPKELADAHNIYKTAREIINKINRRGPDERLTHMSLECSAPEGTLLCVLDFFRPPATSN